MRVLINSYTAAPHLNVQTEGGFGGFGVMYMRDHKYRFGFNVSRTGVRGAGYVTQIVFAGFGRNKAFYI